ncbi:hypothetical protein RU639_005822 [Aspergillus parasiticus]
MGLTDSGKSRFIRDVQIFQLEFERFNSASQAGTESGEPDIRHVKEFPFTTDKGDRVTLVDTPGFDNTKGGCGPGAVRRARGTLRKEKQLLKTQIATLNDALSEKEKAINDLQAEKQLFEAQVNDLNDNLREKDQVNTELRKSIETGRKSLENEIIELRSAVREKEEVVNRLQITLIQEKKLYVDQNAKLNNNS